MGSLVVAVSGTSGAGKSTLVGDLDERLRGLGLCVETVHFDDFTSESDLPEGDVLGWVAGGGQPGEWRAEGMERHLLGLVPNCTDRAECDEWASVVLVEEPFGRARPGLGRLVNISIHLQVPLHLALARRLLREFVPPAGALDESSTADLRFYLDRYLAEGAEFYSLVEAAATANADLVLDGRATRDVLADQAIAAITRRLPVPLDSL